MKVLVVDDDRTLADVLGFTLRREGFTVDVVHTGEAALEAWERNAPDLIVLDINLPRLDGFAVCRQIRAHDAEIPIILLTVRDEENDIIRGLKIGADDYITKPFSPRQLVARAQAVLRRAGKTPTRAIRRVGALMLRSNERELSCGTGEPVVLTRLENRLLDYLMLNHGRIISAEVLINYVWPEGGDRDMLRQLIHRLRTKMAEACRGGSDDLEIHAIENIPGLGYGLKIP
ncbi:MAG: response regulator transcription factor [Anaerolineae bacterium]